MAETSKKIRPAGYEHLFRKFKLSSIALRHQSFVGSSAMHRSVVQDGRIEDMYPSHYWPGDEVTDHLEFALKYDGVNFSALAAIFAETAQEEIIEYILSKPTGKYARRIWFFYELLIGQLLPIDDLKPVNYIDALDVKKYYAVDNGEKLRRYRIVNNLLGNEKFCPIVLRTEKLETWSSENIRKRCEKLIADYPAELFRRALRYLYKKETKSSFAIEHEAPTTSRSDRFIASLQLATKEDFLSKNRLVELQNLIVDPRFWESDYRDNQNYVGQNVAFREIVHLVPPQPQDLPDLMSGLIECHQRMREGNVKSVVHAAVIAYGFVFLHPFNDGNGRIHRFLIHNIVSMRDLTPKGLIFPISAAILKNPRDYEQSLEAFSKPLLSRLQYQLDGDGVMTVDGDTAHLYRDMDMTIQAEALCSFVDKTIDEELTEELCFLEGYTNAKEAIQKIADIPDRLIDLFLQCCLQNGGKLSTRKKESYFAMLRDDEIIAMEEAVALGYGPFES